MTREHGRKYDGRSRPTNDTYKKRWEEIFGKKVTVKDLKNLLTEEEDNGSTEETDRTTD